MNRLVQYLIIWNNVMCIEKGQLRVVEKNTNTIQTSIKKQKQDQKRKQIQKYKCASKVRRYSIIK